MDDNPKWQIGSYAKNRYTGEEWRIGKAYTNTCYLEGLGLIYWEDLNKHYIMSRVANWPPSNNGLHTDAATAPQIQGSGDDTHRAGEA